jgi:CheY-like chemotaxis protein
VTANTTRRVLIVDDDASIRELAAMIAASCGHEALCVQNVAEALDTLACAPVDLVVTDLNMPGAGGLELLAALSARPGSPPALVITGSEDEAALRAARLLGARAVVAKPFGFAELRRAIAAVLSPGRLLATAA